MRLFFTSLTPRTQSIYFLHRDAIVLSSRRNNDDDDGGDRDDEDDGDGDGDGYGDGDVDGEEQIPQLYISKLPINRSSDHYVIMHVCQVPIFLRSNLDISSGKFTAA